MFQPMRIHVRICVSRVKTRSKQNHTSKWRPEDDCSNFERASQRFIISFFEREMTETVESYGQSSDFVTGPDSSEKVPEIRPRSSEALDAKSTKRQSSELQMIRKNVSKAVSNYYVSSPRLCSPLAFQDLLRKIADHFISFKATTATSLNKLSS